MLLPLLLLPLLELALLERLLLVFWLVVPQLPTMIQVMIRAAEQYCDQIYDSSYLGRFMTHFL